MPTLMQKIRLALRGWNRRREEANREFVGKNMWGPASAGPEAADRLKPVLTETVDMEGLTVAFLDDSGRIAYYLDTESGEVVDVRDGTPLAAPRYRRVPTCSTESNAEDRRAFVALHTELADAADFRQTLSKNRTLERAWYNFKNDRAIAAIREWLSK